MTEYCGNEICGRELNGLTSGHASHTTHLDPHYCSRYCREFDEQGLKPINGAEKYGRNQLVGFNWMPAISMKCDNCGKEGQMSSAKAKNGNNRWFCSKECHAEVKKAGKKSNRDYNLLRILRELGWRTTPGKKGRWMYAKEIAKVMEMFNFKSNSASVGMILRLYAKRGIVDIQHECNPLQPLCKYRLKPTLRQVPLGKIVRDYY